MNSIANAAVQRQAAGRFRIPWPVFAFLPISTLDLVLFVLPMLVMGAASVLVIREFHVSLELTSRE